MSHRYLIMLALSAAMTSPAAAQFTTFIPPKAKITDSVKAAVATEQKAQDSVARVQLTNMKTWVDSAAGVIATPMTAADSLVQPTSLDTLAQRRSATDSAPTLRTGARAPATASELPLLALIGVVALGIGTVMLAGNKLGRDRA